MWAMLPWLVFSATGGTDALRDSRAEAFEASVRPILIDYCFDCHGPGSMEGGGLVMGSSDGFLVGGEHGPAVRPGLPQESVLVRAIEYHDPDLQMPPDAPLSEAQRQVLIDWVRQGAYWPAPRAADEAAAVEPSEEGSAWWSFQPIADVAVPAVANKDWPRNELDGFALAAMEDHGLAPAPDADRRTLLRRVSLDLTGLPPTPAQVEAFLADASPRGFERVIDRLLASPAYGERWGRHWLDLARYADTAGDSADYPIADAYKYRDYVIAAFNADKPYDAFLREQIAGDILAEAGTPEHFAERVTATGFLALSRRFGVGARAAKHLTIEDTLDTLGRTTMGLTLRCARCHDHKFDPISTRDYYGLYGIFASTRYPFPGSENLRHPEDLVPIAEPLKVHEARRLHAAALEALQAEARQRQAEVEGVDAAIAELEAVLVRSTEDRTYWEGGERRFLDGGDPAATSLVRDPSTGVLAGAGFVEYRIEVDARGEIELSLCTLGSTHGLRLSFNGRPLAAQPEEIARSPWVPRWSAPIAVTAVRGENRLRIERDVTGAIVCHLGVDPEIGRAAALARLEQERREAKAALEAARGEREVKEKELARANEAVERQQKNPPQFPTAYAVQEGKAEDAAIQIGGSPGQKGDVVPRSVPHVLAADEDLAIAAGSGRLEFAEWLTRSDHPLTARVMVNRIWQHHFGRGLVETPSNFGRQGKRPSHPELLDFLARKFVRLGWSVKALHRWILLSRTYQLSSVGTPESHAADPDNRWFSRASRRRLDAESLRDAMLAVAGRLQPGGGERHPFPAEGKWNYTQHNPFRAVYPSDRRSVYLMTQRIQKHPYLELFDGPDTSESTAVRRVSTVPQQALFFLNSGFVEEQSRVLAEDLLKAVPTDEDRVLQAFLRVLGRPPTEDERGWIRDYLAEACAPTHDAAGEAAPALGAWTGVTRVLFSSNEFCHVE